MQNIVKITTMLNPLELLAPHSCRGCGVIGQPLCNRCKNYIIKHPQNLKPKNYAKNLPPVFIVGQREELVGKLVYDFKFSSVRALAKPLAELIHQTLPKTPESTYIIPLPTIPKHIRARGFDHTLLLAKQLARFRQTKPKKLLIRAKNTVQVGANAETRQTQAKAAYKLSGRAKIDPSATYILLDDILTTGASVKSATKKLQQAGAKKIIVAVLAISSLD